MSEISDYTEKVLSQFAKQITDGVFLLIQQDRELMHDYLKLVEKHSLPVVNRQIGLGVKRRFNLDNDALRQDNPESTLIQSHQEFK